MSPHDQQGFGQFVVEFINGTGIEPPPAPSFLGMLSEINE